MAVTVVASDAGQDDSFGSGPATPDTSLVLTGDLMAMGAIKSNDHLVTPAGWTLYGGTRPPQGGGTVELYTKVALADAPSESFTFSGVGPIGWGFAALRGLDTATYTITFTSSDSSGDATIPNQASYLAGEAICVISVGSRGTGGAPQAVVVPPTGFTTIEDVHSPTSSIIGPVAGVFKLEAAVSDPDGYTGLTIIRGNVLTAFRSWAFYAQPPATSDSDSIGKIRRLRLRSRGTSW